MWEIAIFGETYMFFEEAQKEVTLDHETRKTELQQRMNLGRML